MFRIKEVEKFESVYDLKSSRSILGYAHFPNFEMLDARVASALNKIILNSHFKKKVSLEEQKAQIEDRFLRGRQIAYMIYDNFPTIGAHDIVLDCADLFSMNLYGGDVQEFDTRWDEKLLSMSKIPPDDVLESLDKLRIRDSDQLKTVLELHDLEIHPKISKPDYQKSKTMVRNRTAKSTQKLQERDKASFFSPTEVWCLPAPSVIKLEEREFVVDSGESMHMLSRKDLFSAELEIVRVSQNPTTVVTANGEVQTLKKQQSM